jgi:hypothetical protein
MIRMVFSRSGYCASLLRGEGLHEVAASGQQLRSGALTTGKSNGAAEENP